MRIRYKKWARPELEASKFYEDEPEKWKGKWKEHFENSDLPFMIELGCGKGTFISKLAAQNLDTNYLAIDLIDAMLGLAKRNIETSYKEANLELILTKGVDLTAVNMNWVYSIRGALKSNGFILANLLINFKLSLRTLNDGSYNNNKIFLCNATLSVGSKL